MTEQVMKEFVEFRLKLAKKYPEFAQGLCHQAFGALELWLEMTQNAHYDELEAWWDERHSQFNKIIYG